MLKEDKQEIQKHVGCMNGIFQLFDRRYLVGQRRQQKKLPQGVSDNGKELSNGIEKPKERIVAKEKHRVSVESSRNSFSSSCSSLDCSKRVHTEPSSFCPSIVSEPSSPPSHKNQDSAVKSTDIKDVVKDSMSRPPRVVSVKTVAKDNRKGPTMTHVDSPRPLQHPKQIKIMHERKDQNLVKLREISVSRGGRKVKEIARFSNDERESPYKLKSIANMKENPRFSLDSKRSSVGNLENLENRGCFVDQSQTNEPGSNKRPPSSLVARLMGFEGFNEEAMKTKPCLGDKLMKPRIPLEVAPWKQEVKPSAHGCKSVYGQIEKRLTEIEFEKSGKDLRALKQILEAKRRAKMTDNSSSAIKRDDLQKVTRQRARNLKPIVKKENGKTRKPVSPSASPRLQGSKNGVEKQSVQGNRLQTNGKKSQRRSLSQRSDVGCFPAESDTSSGSQNEPEVMSVDWTQGKKNKVAERLAGYKPLAELAMVTVEQPSPVSVLDAFYVEDTPSPIKKKSYAFKDDDDASFDEREWNQEGAYNLATNIELYQSIPEFHHIKTETIKHLIHQIESLNSNSDESKIKPNINIDHEYITEILSASGLLKNLIVHPNHLHPTSALINPELFNILEKTKKCTKKSEKTRRKMIFDSVNIILVEKVAKWNGRIPNEENLVHELCLEIKKLETSNTSSGLYDEILNMVTEEVHKKSKEWEDNCNEVADVVLDVERLIFKDLVSEIVNGEMSGLQDGPGRHCRQLFLM